MRERPILFSGPMVRAILEGRKTQTRRVIRCQPPADVAPITVSRYHPTVVDRRGDEAPGAEIVGAFSDDGEWGCKSPFGEPGDRLWVRETCRAVELESGLDGVHYPADGAFRAIEDSSDAAGRWIELYAYRGQTGATVPAIHMPRWASRITLEITGVHAERLRGISEADACAEGVTIEDRHTVGYCAGEHLPPSIRAFRELWDGLNAARGHGWEANPWVWVVEFRRIES
ncbi:hypothetical protein [Burkholderia cenocepacia]|uniref:hypothetical protein n=1 Tax=Burkholderia cenocepacia TaxID=95486 RepID=UPI002ABDB6FD|nr:hypothetical protein [Burkholderia cenocepacia]